VESFSGNHLHPAEGLQRGTRVAYPACAGSGEKSRHGFASKTYHRRRKNTRTGRQKISPTTKNKTAGHLSAQRGQDASGEPETALQQLEYLFLDTQESPNTGPRRIPDRGPGAALIRSGLTYSFADVDAFLNYLRDKEWL
jgi:hypothetical protein